MGASGRPVTPGGRLAGAAKADGRADRLIRKGRSGHWARENNQNRLQGNRVGGREGDNCPSGVRSIHWQNL
jgi:hypothetical protein